MNIQEMLNYLNRESHNVGLKLNRNKLKVMLIYNVSKNKMRREITRSPGIYIFWTGGNIKKDHKNEIKWHIIISQNAYNKNRYNKAHLANVHSL